MIEAIFGAVWSLIRDALAIFFAVLRSPLSATSYQPGRSAPVDADAGARLPFAQLMTTGRRRYAHFTPPRKDLPLRFVLLLTVFIALTLLIGITYVCLVIFLQSPNDIQKGAVDTLGHLLDGGIGAIFAIPLGKAAG